MYLVAMRTAQIRGLLSDEDCEKMIAELQTLPKKIQKILDDKERIQWFASKYANAKDMFFLGRGLDYAISLEGSLKMKEISYIHSEAYAAGELKHGTISLIEDNTLVVGILTQSNLYEKTVSNMVEVKSRGAYLMGLTHTEITVLRITQTFPFMYRRQIRILPPVWQLFRCSCWDIMSVLQKVLMWISRETLQNL